MKLGGFEARRFDRVVGVDHDASAEVRQAVQGGRQPRPVHCDEDDVLRGRLVARSRGDRGAEFAREVRERIRAPAVRDDGLKAPAPMIPMVLMTMLLVKGDDSGDKGW
jgi:hypothetical protein